MVMRNRWESELCAPEQLFHPMNQRAEYRNDGEAQLIHWKRQLRRIVCYSQHEVTQILIEAAANESTVALFYQGGSDTGRFRKFTPECVFRTEESLVTYVAGFCHLRRSHRVFRTDRISLA